MAHAIEFGGYNAGIVAGISDDFIEFDEAVADEVNVPVGHRFGEVFNVGGYLIADVVDLLGEFTVAQLSVCTVHGCSFSHELT